MVTLYGIPNCDTVKKARTWLSENHIEYQFHDYKKMGITAEKLAHWCGQLGWEQVLNKKGLTYKKLDDSAKAIINNEVSAIDYMLKATSSIKRPIVETDKGLLLGFVVADFEQEFLKLSIVGI